MNYSTGFSMETHSKPFFEDVDVHSNPNIQILNKLMNEMDDENYKSDEDPVPVINFDDELKYKKDVKSVDIVFVIDCTASLQPYMKGIKRFMRKLVWDANRCMTQYISDEVDIIQVGLVKYRDHQPQSKSFVTEVLDLTGTLEDFKKKVVAMTAAGGGDGPEAVIDGLYDAVKTIQWREGSEKFIYHVLDAPPHGTEFHSMKDAFPQGCPCNKDWEEVLMGMRELEIDYTIIKLSNEIDTMIEKFSNFIKVDVATPDIYFDDSKKVLEQTND